MKRVTYNLTSERRATCPQPARRRLSTKTLWRLYLLCQMATVFGLTVLAILVVGG